MVTGESKVDAEKKFGDDNSRNQGDFPSSQELGAALSHNTYQSKSTWPAMSQLLQFWGWGEIFLAGVCGSGLVIRRRRTNLTFCVVGLFECWSKFPLQEILSSGEYEKQMSIIGSTALRGIGLTKIVTNTRDLGILGEISRGKVVLLLKYGPSSRLNS